MKNNRKNLATLLVGSVLCLHFFACKKYDPGIFVGRYIGTLTYTAIDSIGNAEKTDTFTAIQISSKDVKLSDVWFSLSGNANGNNASISESSNSGNITGSANLNGPTLTVTGVDPTFQGNINFKFVGTKQ